MASKVVRVQEVEDEDESTLFTRKSQDVTLVTGQESKNGKQASFASSGTEEEQNDVEDEGLIEEIQDKVYPLPTDWPKIPQIFRRKSCELTTNTSPCVKKAVSHLELIQNIIEEWFKEMEEERRSQAGSVRPVGSRKQLRFNRSEEKDRESKASSARSKMTISSAASNRTTLSVKGIGASTDEAPKEQLEIPYLGAEDVIDEVITLMARLENDRMETESNLRKEKERVVRLNDRIDNLCLKRMRELPSIVQREHEACIMDLNELQWHVSYAGRNEKRIENKTSIAEKFNRQLKDDIAFVKKHIPLVEEKLELEKLAMEKIKNAQTDTSTELNNTKQRAEKTKAKSNEAEIKAQTERGHIKRELDTVRDVLSAISEELSQAKMTYNAYIHQLNDIKQQLKDNEQELQVLEVKNENAKVAEEMQAKKVRDLQGKITEAEFEHNRLENENIQLQQELDVKKRKNDARIKDLENKVKHKDSKLRTILLKNQEAEMEVQDYYDKISDCQRQKVADEKNIARIQKEMVKLAQQMQVTMEEYNKVQTINQTIREQLHAEEEKAFRMEESLKATADTLRRQVKDEVHTRTVLVARIKSDSTDLSKYRTDNQVKNEKAKKVADDVVNVVKDVETKVERLRSAKNEKKKQKDKLRGQLDETRKQEEESRKNFDEQLDEINPHHSHLKTDVLNLDKRLDHMEWKTDLMNKQMDDMDREQGTMDRLTKTTEKAIADLDEVLEELNLQLQAAQRIEDGIRVTYNQVLGRIKDNEAEHRKFKETRTRFLAETEVQKTRKLQINKELASKYRQLQNEYLVLKDKLLNNFDARVKLENAIKDSRQLKSLQKRMHGAMLEYFKYRGMYNKSELGRMENESDDNSNKVLELQAEMNTALAKISEFLETQMDGTTARKIAWQAIQNQQEEEAKQQQRAERRSTSELPPIRQSRDAASGPSPVIPPIRQSSMIKA